MSLEQREYALKGEKLNWGEGIEVHAFKIPRSRSLNPFTFQRQRGCIRLERQEKPPQALQISVEDFSAGYKKSMEQLHAPIPASEPRMIRIRRAISGRHGRQPSNT